jgi:hypothetical protein
MNNYIQHNQFTTINNTTQYYSNIIKQALKQYNNKLQKENFRKYTNVNPTAPKPICHNKATRNKHTH